MSFPFDKARKELTGNSRSLLLQQHNQDDNQPDGQKLQLQVIRRPGQRVKADRYAPRVLKLVGEGQSYREISHRLGLSKNTILDIVKRDRVA